MKYDFYLAKKYDGSGHCQINYFSRNDKGQVLRYCLQQNFNEIRLMRCSDDWEVDFEPSYEIWVPNFLTFEKPVGDSKLEKMVVKWIEERENEIIKT